MCAPCYHFRPLKGRTTKFQLKPGRELTQLGGHGVARQLPHTRSTPGVFWSPRFNSYVAVYDPLRAVPYPRQSSANPYFVASINGIGEIRWTVELDSPSSSCDGEAALAVAYFFDRTEE
jgi:hypothetical protein